MTSRSQYLLFLFIWLTAIFVIFFVALAGGVPMDARGLRGDFLIAGVIALPACDQEQEVSLTEIVSGLGQATDSEDLTKDLK